MNSILTFRQLSVLVRMDPLTSPIIHAVPSDKTKHINISLYHHIRDLVETGKINLLHFPSKNNLADINTKALPRPQFLYLTEQVLGRQY